VHPVAPGDTLARIAGRSACHGANADRARSR